MLYIACLNANSCTYFLYSYFYYLFIFLFIYCVIYCSIMYIFYVLHTPLFYFLTFLYVYIRAVFLILMFTTVLARIVIFFPGKSAELMLFRSYFGER